MLHRCLSNKPLGHKHLDDVELQLWLKLQVVNRVAFMLKSVKIPDRYTKNSADIRTI